MIESVAIARPYARAAFELARQEDQLLSWADMLRTVGAIVSDDRMRLLIHHPKFSKKQLLELVLDICSGAFSTTQENFISLLVETDRLVVAPVILELFQKQMAVAEGITKIQVTTPYALSDEQKKTLSATMVSRLGGHVDLENEVDQSLIGGAVIKFSDQVIDASIKGKLQDLNQVLSS